MRQVVKRGTSRTFAVGLAVAGLGLAACGNGGSSSGAAERDKELVIGSIFSTSGAATQPAYVNGVKMAVQEINDAGGIDGTKVVLKEYDDALDAQKAVSAARLAVKDKVDVIIGSATVVQTNAIADIFKKAGIPYINMSSSTPVALDESLGSETTFRMVTAQPEQIYGAVQWIQDKLKPTNIGLMGLAADFGKDALPRFKAPLEKGGAKIVNERLYPQGTADLTNEMLAMKGSDLVVNWAYPPDLALALKTAAQMDLGDVPMLSAGSASLVNSMKLVDVALQKNLYGTAACDPVSDDRAHVQAWAKKFQGKFNALADYASAVAYDAVNLAVAAGNEGAGFDSKSIAEGLKTVTFNDNTMCATEYKSDDRHELMHEAVIVNFEGGNPKLVAKYTSDKLLGQGSKQG